MDTSFLINNAHNTIQAKKDVSFRGNNQVNSYTSPQSTGIYPVYTEVPYGINCPEYIKLGAQKTPSGDIMHIYRLKNGQNVEIVQKDGKPLVITNVDVGASDEDGFHTGISHLIEHSMYHSCKNHSDIDKEIEEFTYYSNACTSKFNTLYQLILNENNMDDLSHAIEIQSSMLNTPEFSKLEKEKATVTQEAMEIIKDVHNKFSDRKTSALFKNMKENNISGNPDDIKNITKEEMLKYWEKFYTPQNYNTYISSSFNPDYVIKTVAKYFNQRTVKNDTKTRHKEYIPNNSFVRNDMISPTDTIGEVYFSFLTPIIADTKENIKARALLSLIKTRSNYLDYSIDQPCNKYCETMLSADLNKRDEYEVLEEVNKQLQLVKKEPVSEYELGKIKNTLLEKLKQNFETDNDIIENFSSYLTASQICDLSKIEKIINNLTPDDIQDALKYINFNNCSMSVIHPVGSDLNKINAKYNNSLTSAKLLTIPVYTNKIDVSNSLVQYPIQANKNLKTFSTILPDNTNLIISNSKEKDDCSILWELSNKNQNTYNPAIKYLLSHYEANHDTAENYILSKTNSRECFNFDGKNQFFGVIKCKPEYIEENIKLLKSELNFDISQKYFEELKELALCDINNLQETSIDKYNQDKLGSGYSKNSEYLKKELEKLTLNDVKQYINDMISNSYSTVAVSMPFENLQDINRVASTINIPDFQFKKIDEDFYFQKFVPTEKSKCYLAEQKNGQNEYQMIYNFKTSGNKKDEMIFEILTKILRNKIFDELREKQGLSYSPGACIDFDNNGQVVLYAVSDVKTKNEIQKIFNAFKNEIQRLKTNPITQEELIKEKQKQKGKILDLYNTEQKETNINLFVNAKKKGGLSSMSNEIDIINSITSDDILKAANYIFNNLPDYCIDVDKNTLENNKDYFNSLS